jgi:hypothetical protein
MDETMKENSLRPAGETPTRKKVLEDDIAIIERRLAQLNEGGQEDYAGELEALDLGLKSRNTELAELQRSDAGIRHAQELGTPGMVSSPDRGPAHDVASME